MIAGVDGTRDGWVVAIADGWPCPSAPRMHLAATFAEVVTLTADCDAVAVDMPLGLPSRGDVRQCDELARKELAARSGPDVKASSRVFLAPPREAVYGHGGSPKVFQTLHREHRGVGAGLPVWGIVPKLIEADEALCAQPALQDRIVECHPELAFARLAGQVLPSKHAAPGVLQRMALLSRHITEFHDIALSGAFRSATVDDILDALVCLSTAAYLATEADISSPQSRRLPSQSVPRDARGLRMEIWF
ncbi:DUF429 domain-containing protein [Desulfobaculum sp.]